MRWAYGITTVPERMRDEFNRTVDSLKQAGFDNPRIFIDGWDGHGKLYNRYNHLEITSRYPKIRIYGNWILSLAELYIRNPDAEVFAIFQDDLVTCKNLRRYLEISLHQGLVPQKSYLNLYTFRENETLVQEKEIGWHEAAELNSTSAATYHGKVQQAGRSALGLVFTRDAVSILLCHQHMVMKPLDVHHGWRRVDGAVCEAMNKVGWREYIHNPSLLQHTGTNNSTIGNHCKPANTFRGEEYNALDLLPTPLTTET